MRKSPAPSFHDVQVRAYYAWLNSGAEHGNHETHWHAAEAAQRRSDAAKRSAATRAANRALNAEATARADFALRREACVERSIAMHGTQRRRHCAAATPVVY